MWATPHVAAQERILSALVSSRGRMHCRSRGGLQPSPIKTPSAQTHL